MRRASTIALAGLVAAAVAQAAHAQTVDAHTGAPPSAVPQTAEPLARSASQVSEDAAIDTWINEAAGEPGDVAAGEETTLAGPRRIHGMVGATVGSGGLRSLYGYATAPFGQASSVTVAGSDTQWRSRRWGGTHEQRTLAIGLYLDASDISRLLHRDHRCDYRQWAIKLRQDPVVNEDGSCERVR